jgi:phytoene desaturase
MAVSAYERSISGLYGQLQRYCLECKKPCISAENELLVLKKLHIGIVGAGIAGIATAIRLAAQGHQVMVLEANAYPGGKLSAFEQEGYRFDAGPSLFTMPQYVEDLFAVAGEDVRTHFRYQKMETACCYAWPDGSRLRAWADRDQFAVETQRVLGVPIEKIDHYLQKSATKYQLAGRIFLEKSLHRVRTWVSWPVLQSLLRLPFFDIFTSMHRVNERSFGHPKLTQLFDRYATYNGSNPYKAPGMLTIIPHFEHNIGVFYPEGGMHRITQALYDLSLRQGVQYYFNTPVTRIAHAGGRVTGLVTQQDTYTFDRVVSNMDVYYTYHRLLPDLPRPERILRQPKSTSALIFYWGIRRTFPELDLHNIFFSEDYATEFAALEKGQVSADPTIYVNITSKYTPADAPEGCENWFVMINVPPNAGQDWPVLIDVIRQQTIDKLSRHFGLDFAALIACESVLDPRSIESKTSSHQGALYGYSSNNQMAAFLRHANFSRRLDGLYFCGGSVHPGGGIPLCLLSAKIVAEELR